MNDSAGAFAFWIAVGVGSLGLFLGPIGAALGKGLEALGRRLGPGPAPERDPSREEDAARLEAMEHRVGELEERLDFTERILAQSRQAMLNDADTPPEALPAAGVR